MVAEYDVRLADGRVLRVHDAGDPRVEPSLSLIWHHGSPQTGAILEPVLAAAAARGIRVYAYARPSYGGSSPNPGRDVASAGDDVRHLADALGLAKIAVVGASGGGPHALACAARMPDRVIGAVAIASPAPFSGDEAWFTGMIAPGGLRAAAGGRGARARFAETDEFNAASFTPADYDALSGDWRSLGADAVRAEADGPDGLIDDDVAFVTPWGFGLEEIGGPVLLVQGGEDRVIPSAHANRLLSAIPTAELWLRPLDGHVSALRAVPVAMDWLLELQRRS